MHKIINPFSIQSFLATILSQRQVIILALVIPILISCGGGGGGGSAPEPAPTPTFTVSASAGAGGSISPSSITVTQGQTTTFTITPEVAYAFLSITGCNGTLKTLLFLLILVSILLFVIQVTHHRIPAFNLSYLSTLIMMSGKIL